MEALVAEDCQSHLEINIDENGHGYMSKVEFSGNEACLALQPETETGGAKKPWEVQMWESGGAWMLDVNFDLDTPVGPMNGLATLRVGGNVCCLRAYEVDIDSFEFDKGPDAAAAFWFLLTDQNESNVDRFEITHL